MRLVAGSSVPDETVVLSYYQQKGRGQQGNHWESAPGMNLLASIIVFPVFLSPAKQFSLSKIVSLSLVDWLRQETEGVTIKWPNDIYISERKIAGILIETTVQGDLLHSAVIGIGMNLNQETFSPALPNPVGLKQFTGRNYDLYTVVQQVREIFSGWYRILKAGRTLEIDAAYRNALFRNNQWSLFRKADALLEARIAGIGEFGQLILEERPGKRSEYHFREIEFVI